MHNHKTVLSLGLVVALVAVVILGSIVLGKQSVQDRVGQVHLVEITKTFQDFQNAPIIGGERKLKILDLPPGGDTPFIFANFPIDFVSSFTSNPSFIFSVEGNIDSPISQCHGGFTVNPHPSNPSLTQGAAEGFFCDISNPTPLYATGDKSMIDALTQGEMRIFAYYIVH